MSYPCYGRYAVAEPPSNLASLHFHNPNLALRVVDHEPKVGVLDQSDLLAKGIHCSGVHPRARRTWMNWGPARRTLRRARALIPVGSASTFT